MIMLLSSSSSLLLLVQVLLVISKFSSASVLQCLCVSSSYELCKVFQKQCSVLCLCNQFVFDWLVGWWVGEWMDWLIQIDWSIDWFSGLVWWCLWLICHYRSLKQTQQGLKIVIICCVCFAVVVTLALIITICVLPPQVIFGIHSVSDL